MLVIVDPCRVTAALHRPWCRQLSAGNSGSGTIQIQRWSSPSLAGAVGAAIDLASSGLHDGVRRFPPVRSFRHMRSEQLAEERPGWDDDRLLGDEAIGGLVREARHRLESVRRFGLGLEVA